eukprot:366142-Chlamydomonas_euryale.AAC.6
MSYSLSTVALPMCTSLVTPSVTEGMSLLMACFTRFVATTNDSDTACVTCGSGCPAVSTAHSIRRNVGALPASSACDVCGVVRGCVRVCEGGGRVGLV